MPKTAVCNRDLKNLKEIIEEGHSVNATDCTGDTALHIAALNEFTEILDFLLQQPDIELNCGNQYDETPLLLSIVGGSTVAAIKLIEAGANVNIHDQHDNSPLHYAVEKGQLDVASLLIQKGADINTTSMSTFTPLHVAVTNSNFEMVAMLLYYGADTDVVMEEGWTPFMLALAVKNVEIPRLLLEYEVDIDRTNKKGLSALQMAFKFKSPMMVLELIERGANVNHNSPNVIESDVLYNALQYKDNSLFKIIWDKCNYHIIYADKDYYPPLIVALDKSRLPTKDWLECVTMVFHSHLIHDVIQDYRCVYEPPKTVSGKAVCGLVIRMFAERKFSEDDLFPFICISLSEGAIVHFCDIVTLYDCYGYNNKMLMFLLQFNVEMNRLRYGTYPILPVFICDVAKDPKTELVKLRIGKDSKYVNYINDLLDMFTPPPEFVNRIEEFLKKNPELENEFESIRERLKRLSVASLLELSRDALKKAICNKLAITNSLEFYAALKKLPIPSLLKKIMVYQVPVNK